jgi:6-phosphofructokinase
MAELDMNKVQQDFATEGAYKVIRRYVREGKIAPETGVRWAAQIFEALAIKAEEAQKEVGHLKQVVERLQHVCRQGKPQSFDRLEATLQTLAREMTTFDGWVISLYETELTMLWMVNPERAKAKPLEMARSMEELTSKRMTERDFMLKAPDLFKVG